MLGDTLMTPDYNAFQMRSSGYGQAGIGQYSGECLIKEHHEKAPVRCPCSRLAALHAAPRTPYTDVFQ